MRHRLRRSASIKRCVIGLLSVLIAAAVVRAQVAADTDETQTEPPLEQLDGQMTIETDLGGSSEQVPSVLDLLESLPGLVQAAISPHLSDELPG